MMQGFESPEPRRADTARRMSLGIAWLAGLGLTVALFVQSLYESTVAAVALGALLAALLLLPPLGLHRDGRVWLDTPEWDQRDNVRGALVHRG